MAKKFSKYFDDQFIDASAVGTQELYVYCPVCSRTHTIELRTRYEKAAIHGVVVQYLASKCYCPTTKTEYYNSKLLRLNRQSLERAYQKYVKEHTESEGSEAPSEEGTA